jgi:hypothetical protein
MSLSSWDVWCWLIGVIGFLTLTTVLIVRKRYRVFPWFTSLLLFEIAQTAVLFLVHLYGGNQLYFQMYWCGEMVEALVRVGVVFELARITARHLGVAERQLVYALISATVACSYVIWRFPGLEDPVVTFAIKVSLCTSILSGFLALTIFAVTFFEGIRFRIHSQAVTYGLVAYFAGKLVSELAILLQEHGWWLTLQNWLKPLYIVCLFAWAAVFWFDEPRQILNDEMEGIRNTLAILEAQKHAAQQRGGGI